MPSTKAAEASVDRVPHVEQATEGDLRRGSERLTINKEFESFDAFIHEYVTNISKSGVFIKSKSPLPVGTKVNLRFTLIMDDIETIEGTGEVVRVENEPAGMGIVFHELEGDSQALIARLLATHAA
jgi:Tfp pilus assembly protein PilZ